MKLRKNNLNKAFAFILILALLLAGGCSRTKEANPEPSTKTRVVTDCVGRQVKVPVTVNRIACLCPESGYTLAMFGKGDKIVAVVGGLKRDVIFTSMYPAVKNLPVPKASSTINIEELVRTRPDVVFVKEDTMRSQAEVQKLNISHIPFLVVKYNNIKEQQLAVEMMGKVVGSEDKAAEYKTYYKKTVDLVQKRVAGIPQQDRIKVYHSVNEATRTDAKGSLAADWTNVAGADNVSVNQNLKQIEGNYFASLEQILLWNPEVIFVNDPIVVKYIMGNNQWSSIKAVKNNRVIPLPDGISRWGHPSSPETPLVILWTASTLYPDKFKDIDMRAETKYFYKEFFSYNLSNEEITKILSGVGMRELRS
ncbi:MAG TPA: ABC transporter substrate-binding protein [Syntrophomonadaceae bacterium]|nr:ABC transporter substrate-binding protein [Syntrophomonadaceae bacterium]